MKNAFVSTLLLALLAFSASAQLDRSQQPQPGPAPVIRLGEFESFTMDNGLRVIVVENDKVPVVSFQMTLDIDPVMEGDAKGFVDLGGALLREGTASRSKAEIDEQIDFIGASLSTFSTGLFGSSLSRHTETLLELMSDILLHPSFPEEELQRLVTQNISALATVRSDANAMARNVATAVTYGPEHPYGEITTEESLRQVDIGRIQDYYKTYFRPNVAYMVVVGDITAERARQLLERYFSAWEPAEVPRHTYPTPQPPPGRRVAFAERAGAIQSVVTVTYPVKLSPGHPDAIKASVMNTILGGSFTSRLMQNLREDKGYTYGARSGLSTDRLVGRFTAGTEVRNSVTDSTLVEIFSEMQRLIEEPIAAEDLQMIKNYMTGTFARSLESPRTMAGFALNIARYNLPEDYYATYLEKLNDVSPEDIREVAATYLKPDNAVIVVAGNRDEVVDQLVRFSATGEVELFDAFGRPVVQEAVAMEAGMTAQGVIDRYIRAIGGRERLEGVRDMSQEMSMAVMGQQATIKTYQMTPGLLLAETLMGGMSLSKQLFDGTKLVVTSPVGRQEFTEGPVVEQARMQAVMFPELKYGEMGVTARLMGAETLDGESVYRLELTNPDGNKSYDYYSMETGLKIRSMGDQASASFGNYTEVQGIKMPFKMTQEAGGQVIETTVVEVRINSGLERSFFTVD
jgi:predicted Zn-dependent peptidase